MTKFTPWLAGACLLASTTLVSCHGPKEAVAGSSTTFKSRAPQFIEDITLGKGSNSTIGISNIVDNQPPGNPNINPYESNTLQEKYASILGVIPKSITNYTLYNFIDEWLGVAYRMGGNSKAGIDCSAFVQRLYQDVFGTNLVRTAFDQFNNCARLSKKDQMHEGDLVFFSIHSKHITHVGIYLMNSYFVHASSSGVMISSLNEDYWHKYFTGAGQVPVANKTQG